MPGAVVEPLIALSIFYVAVDHVLGGESRHRLAVSSASACCTANARGKRVVLLTHQPMNVPFGSPSTYDRYGELLERYKTELILVGHEHSNDADVDAEFVKRAKHVQTNSSSYTIDSSPQGFRYVRMAGLNCDNPFRKYGVQQSLTITAPAPGVELAEGDLGEVQVNAYDSSDAVARVRWRRAAPTRGARKQTCVHLIRCSCPRWRARARSARRRLLRSLRQATRCAGR